MESEGPPGGEATFEKELRNLERVVSLLERGELDLEEAIRQYEAGHRSLKRCYEILEGAQKRIEILTGTAGFSPWTPPASPPAEGVLPGEESSPERCAPAGGEDQEPISRSRAQ